MTTGRPWLLALLSRLLRPRARLTVSQWADAHRILSPKASSEPGPWRTSRMPHLREIMDVLSADHPAQRVVYKKPAQHGGTEVMANWIGYVMDYVRTAKPMQIVIPTDKLLVRWRHQRLNPMIEGADCLREKVDISKSRDGTNRLDLIDYPGGLLYLTTAGSASNLKSDSVCYTVCDEIDEYDWDIQGRGDPMGLIESRQANFPRRKLYMCSTPTVRGSSRIDIEYESSDQRRRYIRCPHCDEWQTLEWAHLHWDTALTRAWYACAHNGCVIDEHDKPTLLAAAEWRATYPERDVIGFHDNALYNPIGLGYSWLELAKQWVRADTDELKQQFVNERLALAWVDKRTDIHLDDLAARAEPYPLRQIPHGVGLITAGVDTQDNRLAVQLVGWGESGRWWVLDYVELPGDPALPEVWVALDDLLGRPLATARGTILGIEATAIDMQGHKTEHVKAYVANTRRRRVLAIAGSRYRLIVPLGKPRKTEFRPSGRTIAHGLAYHEVGTEIIKDRLFGDLRADADQAPADRRAHFSQDLPPEYFAGLLSEVWDARKRRYVPRRGATERNEPLDCFDADTEVLTDEGWKLFRDIIGNERLATVDMETLIMSYERPTKLICRRHDGDMIALKGRRIDVLVTPNHRMVTFKKEFDRSIMKWRFDVPAKITLAKDLTIHHQILAAPIGVEDVGSDVFRIPASISQQGVLIEPEREVNGEDWAAFLGWYVSEGSSTIGTSRTQGNTRRRVQICNKDERKSAAIRLLLARLPWRFRETVRECGIVVWECTSKQLFDAVACCGRGAENKIVPNAIKLAQRRVIQSFVDAAMDGDGWEMSSGNQRVPHRIYSTISRKLADDMQELLLKIGKASSLRQRSNEKWNIDGRSGDNGKPIYMVSEISLRKASLDTSLGGKRRFLGEIVHYTGNVYCATVPSGTLVLRRNGKTFVAGNCWVYAYAAAHHPEIRLDKLRAVDWELRRRRLWPEGEPAPSSEPPADPPPPAPTPPPAPPAARPLPPRPPSRGNFVQGWRR